MQRKKETKKKEEEEVVGGRLKKQPLSMRPYHGESSGGGEEIC